MKYLMTMKIKRIYRNRQKENVSGRKDIQIQSQVGPEN